MAKLLIKHPELRPYRISFYDAVATRHNIRFLLNRSPKCGHFDHTVIGTTKSSMWRDGRSVKAFLREVTLGEYDVSVSSTPTASATIAAVAIAKIRRKKVILWTEQWRSNWSGWKGRMRRLLLRKMYRLTDAHFVTGTKTATFLRHSFHVADSAIFFAPQCSIDLAGIAPAPIELDIPRDAFVFLFLARIIDWKGLDYLIRGFAQLQKDYPEAFLLIVGDGEETDRCRQLARDLKLANYSFFGAIADNNDATKAALYASCSVFVLPSRITKTNHEGWGLVVGEAMSLGKPVIITDAVGCADDMIEQGVNGYVVCHSSVDDLADAMKRTLEHRDELSSMGKVSREIFEREISYDRMSQAFLDAIAYVSLL